MIKMNRLIGGVLVIALALSSCSTEKNTLLGRTYHGTTAHYNGYFNANDLLSEAINSYRTNVKEDFYNTLVLRPLPNEEEVKALYSPIDTAVAKCTKVIQKHAMPSMDAAERKKDEHNNWIDENWITIGIANFYRRDYPLALKNFEYTKKFFEFDKSTYLANIWIARTQIQTDKLTEASFVLDELDKAIKETAERKKNKSSKKKKKSKKNSDNREDKDPPKFPKKWRLEVEITRAMLAEKRGDKEAEIKALQEALKYAKKSSDKARFNFILGQLTEKTGSRDLAAQYYEKVLKYNAGFEMSFNARLKKALNGGTAEVKEDLKKMLRDDKNLDFKDQIYFTLAQIAENEGDITNAISYYTQAAFYSTTNAQQKGMAYEHLGDIYFSKKEYVASQKYYDSCTVVMPEKYPNGDVVRNKAAKLQDLVTNIETAHYEDSVQRIAGLPEDERLAFAEKTVKQIKEEEAKRKRLDAEKLAKLQEQAAKSTPADGSKWYWNNPKVVKDGFDEYKRQWGGRENLDDWRRSDRIILSAAVVDDSASTMTKKDPVDVPTDSLTAKMLLDKLPLSDSALAASRERMMFSYFEAGRIYQDQLNEKKLAAQQYQAVLDKKFESKYKLLSAYQMYRLNDPGTADANEHRNYILTNYPTSDYAGFLRDPDYFLKKKERDKELEKEYLIDLDRYERQLYYPVIAKADQVLTTQKDSPLRSKYYLLKVRALAKVTESKDSLVPYLDSLIAEFPKTPESKKAQEMKDIIKNGYSKNLPVDFSKKSVYNFKEGERVNVVVFVDPAKKDITSVIAKARVSEFNKEYFGRERFITTSKILGEQTVVIVKEMEDEIDGAKYIATFKKTKKHLLDLQEAKVFFITNENLKTLFETMKVEEYEIFYDEHY